MCEMHGLTLAHIESKEEAKEVVRSMGLFDVDEIWLQLEKKNRIITVERVQDVDTAEPMLEWIGEDPTPVKQRFDLFDFELDDPDFTCIGFSASNDELKMVDRHNTERYPVLCMDGKGKVCVIYLYLYTYSYFH